MNRTTSAAEIRAVHVMLEAVCRQVHDPLPRNLLGFVTGPTWYPEIGNATVVFWMIDRKYIFETAGELSDEKGDSQHVG